MNELRWILLGIGVLIIAVIYILGSRKYKRDIRARVEKYPSLDRGNMSNIRLEPGKEKLIDISGALATINTYLKQAREPAVSVDVQIKKEKVELDNKSTPVESADSHKNKTVDHLAKDQEIIIIYITAKSPSYFKGDEILQILESSNMQFGTMDIFHHFGPDKKYSSRALFSLANIHEPGTFNLEKINEFTTDGLAMFMSLPAEIGGDIAIEIMLDTAQNISYLLDGELKGANRKILTLDDINKLREKAGHY
jgi:cell division protein ZipA